MHLPYLTLVLLASLSTASVLPDRNITISSRQAEICDTCQPNAAGYVIDAALEEEPAITRQKKCKPLNAKCKKTKQCCMGVCRRAMLFKYCVRPERKGKKKFEVWQGGSLESDDGVDDEEEDAGDDTQVE
ncbi:hypothetical protein ASPWEDRAFT_185378 [Aspergillus wentii DTO 134E9]|uniref:Uncharacterized protein n=1 Tax=Aspergillus wentii DTO 134E9 TaxID=1073089 RepID=A0A1L9RDC5_ASPWE|nr:uncharacterized protein ASPWEDRAFT_185378 [Aspergillus wentii DTO 134E9]KAI9933198.1 hypothetical protein MW887_007670 [Aspergillus wentii]OJJ32925.1 hypothetical protein ASPWEDRAFT_185378 [Aspergillus wentii DTO 134E9]